MKKDKPEHREQSAFFDYVIMRANQTPELRLMHAIPNGQLLLSKITDERGRMVFLSYLKKEGLKKGVLDVHLPVARGDYHSLYIEFKSGSNKLSWEQAEFIQMLQKAGNCAEVCYGSEEAIKVLEAYLKLKPGKSL